MKVVSQFKHLRWGNLLLLLSTPLVAISGLSFLFMNGAIRPPTVALAAVLAIATGISITAGYHRLFAHRSYEASVPVRFFLLIFGAASFENSALVWSQDHRDHHAFVDTDRDPYSIKRGFWFAHIGWIVSPKQPSTANVSDLERDALVRWQHRHFGLVGLLIGFALPTAVASLWGDALGGLLIGGFARMVLNHHCTFMINSVCHYLGRQPYSNRDTSRDSWVAALLTYGEGYHNYHHTFPSDYRNGVRALQWDPTKWFIRAFAWIGQARGLRRISRVTILRARVRQEEQVLLRSSAAPTGIEELKALTEPAREQLERACAQAEAMRSEYRRLKGAGRHMLGVGHRTMLATLNQRRQEYRQARRDFRRAWSQWRELTSSLRMAPA